MNITEFMSFDLEWFKTLPGILITGGVIVLLIALIIFIISNKKTEKIDATEVETNTVPQEVPIANTNSEMPINEQATAETNFMDNSMPVNNVATKSTNDTVVDNTNVTVPVNNAQTITSNINTVQSPVITEPTVVEPINSAEPTVANNVIDFNVPVANVPTVEPVQNTVVETSVEQPTIPVMEDNYMPNETKIESVTQPLKEEKPMIYGGVNPVNTIANNTENVKPVIYGGADPLENTTTIPRMNNNGFYNISSNVNAVPTEFVETPAITTPEPVINTVQAPSVDIQQPVATSTMPITGAEMFGTSDNNNGNTTNSEIETLEF